MIYFSSDYHFRHSRLLTFDEPGEGRNRFRSIEECEAYITNECGKVFRWDDTVIFVGDMTMGQEKAQYSIKWIKSRLWTKFIYVVGNHCPNPQILMDEWTKNGDGRDFTAVYQHVIVEDGIVYNIQHYPPVEADVERHAEYHQKGRLAKFLKDSNPGGVVIHGHTHQNQFAKVLEDGTICIHCGVDANEYAPVSFDTIKQAVDNIRSMN